MNWANIIVFLGCVQGFSLLFFLLKRGNKNLKSYIPFSIFLGSICFFNLIYLTIYNGIWMFSSLPIPYKYLIGVGFFFFIKSHFISKKESLFRKEFYLFIPAVLYGLIRLYWWVIKITINPNIVREVYDTGFFTYNEFCYLVFNLIIAVVIIVRLNVYLRESQIHRFVKKVKWLRAFSVCFLAYTSFLLIELTYFSLRGLNDSIDYYYPILFLNTIYMYYLGYIGFTKQQELFSVQLNDTNFSNSRNVILQEEVRKKLIEEELYLQPNLKITELAIQLDTSTKQISDLVAASGMNFSQYINKLRVEKVKELLRSGMQETHTLEALAKEAGFNSKTSFNTCFKKVTGLTPSAFVKSLSK